MNLLLGLPLGIFRMLGVMAMMLLRLAPVILVSLLVMWVCRKHRNMAQSHDSASETPPKRKKRAPNFTGPVVTVDYKEVKEEDVCAQPDSPAAFGYKPSWLAIRSRDPRAVMAALGLQNCRPVSWTCGLSGVTAGKCFVSPCLDGWVLVVGAGEKPVSREHFAALNRRFSEVQAFVANRESSVFSWAKYQGGICIRAYAISRGQVLTDQGELTMEEISLGFGRFPRKNGSSREDFPTGDSVLAIAAAWGMDPMLEQHHYPPSTGWLCTAE